jgi:hypothetical protein
VVCINSKTGRKGGGSAEDAAAGLLTKKRQNGRLNVIFEVMSEVQKGPEDVSAGIGQKTKYKVLNKFSCNLRSKSARSTLTSPGPIRVKEGNRTVR